MICQFHPGTFEAPNPWRLMTPTNSNSLHAYPSLCFHGIRNFSCPGNPVACCHSNVVHCCQGAGMLGHLTGAWPLWTQNSVAAATQPTTTEGACYHSKRITKGTNCESAKKNKTPFSISAILDGPSSVAEKKDNRTPTKAIVRPWDDDDDDLSSDRSSYRSSTKDWRRSVREEEEVEEEEDDEEDGERQEEKIDVGVGRETSSSTFSSSPSSSLFAADSSKSNCPLDALLQMTTRTRFEQNEADTTDYTTDYTSHDSSVDRNRFQVPLKNASIFHRSSHPSRKRRKTRTAFTNHQIFQLEKRFLYQKYLTPSDRDELALSLRLSNSQVITWFQNRRAKLKRDLEELKADVSAAKALGNEPSTSVLNRLDELMKANDNALKRKDHSSGKNTGEVCRSSQTTSKHFIASKTDENAVSTTVKDNNLS